MERVPVKVLFAYPERGDKESIRIKTESGEYYIAKRLIDEDELAEYPDVEELNLPRWLVDKEGIE